MTEEQVFLAALDLPDAAARAAYLEEQCGADGEFRRQVEALLASHYRSGEFLDVPAAEQIGTDSGNLNTVVLARDAAPAGQHPDDEPDALHFLTPSTRPDSLGRIGHYEVLEVLGKGGFGTVLRAFDDVLQRVVAIKVLAPELAVTSPARKRFLREAQSTAKVRHENVVQVYETQEKPLPYLVMEFIPGETLQQRLDRRGPLETAEIVQLGRQIAAGLAAAHATGLIHRDVKPGNILIEAGPSERVKLTDFGLARAADDASMTQSGVVAGTPTFMAPEQARGESLDHRADLFSLGSVLYTMCSGRPPFRAATTFAVLKRVVEDEPRPIRELIPETPEWLCDIISKLHAKNPAERFQSAREVAELLADCEAKLKAQREIETILPTPAAEKPTLAEPPSDPEMRPLMVPTGIRWPLLIATGIMFLLTALLLAVTESTGLTRFFSDSGAAPVMSPPVPSPPVAGDKDVAEPLPADANPAAQREALEHALAHGGRVVLIVDGKKPSFAGDSATLPEPPYRVENLLLAEAHTLDAKTVEGLKDIPPVGFLLSLGPGIDDSAFAKLSTYPGMVTPVSMALSLTKITGDGLAPVKNFTRLRTLALGSDSATAKGLAHLRDLRVPDLHLYNCKRIDENACAVLAEMPGLMEVRLDGSPVTDAGLAKLAACKKLRTLHVRRCSVSREGVEKLAKSLPQCQIYWDGGVTTPLVGSQLSPALDGRKPSDGRPVAAADPGFVPLFNGQDLAGWKSNIQGDLPWTWAEGVLTFKGRGDLLVTERNDYENFHLRMTIKSKPGSSVWIRLRDASGNHYLTGIRSAIRPDMLLGGGLSVLPRNQKQRGLAQNADVGPADQWHTLEVIAVGNRIQTFVNSKPVADVTDPDRTSMRGSIALSLLGRTPQEVHFKDVEIKELAAATSRDVPPPTSPANADSKLVKLRSFTPGKDKLPIALRPNGKKVVTVEGDSWRIENSGQQGNFHVMIAQMLDDIPQDGVLAFRAKVRVETKHELAWGSLGFGGANHRFIDWDQWPDALAYYDAQDAEWAEKEVRHPVAECRKSDPPAIYLYAGFHADGVIWLKDVELLHLPSGAPAPQANMPPRDATPFSDADAQRIAALPAAEQVREVRQELQRLNPGFDGKLAHKIDEGGVVTHLGINTDEIVNIAPLRALAGLADLDLRGTYRDKGKLVDLSPLAGMTLSKLDCSSTQVSDLTPLAGMPLATLHFNHNPVSDLTPLKGMHSLRSLGCAETKVFDLSPLKGLKLESLGAQLLPVTDLSPLTGMPLKALDLYHTIGVTNLAPLKGMPLEGLNLQDVPVTDLSPLAGMTSLRSLLLQGCEVSDLTPLQGLKLTDLIIRDKQVCDLSPLKGMPLVRLDIYGAGVSDLNALRGMELVEIRLTPRNITLGLDALRGMQTLKTIITGPGNDGWPAAEFWERYDKGEFK